MKRSNRLVLLVGVFLAVIAFVGVLLLSQSKAPRPPEEATQATVVIAAEDIPLGTVIEEEMLDDGRTWPSTAALPGAYRIPPRRSARSPARRSSKASRSRRRSRHPSCDRDEQIDVPAGYRAMSVMVDQVSGVGTLIKTGDFVDMLIRMDIKPVVVNEDGTSATAIDAIDGDTSKLLLQGMQVLGTLLPPPPAAAGGATPHPGTALTERQELVILAVTPAQAEVVKWAQNDAQVSMSLVLRSPDDFIDADGNRLTPESPCLTVRPPATAADRRRRRPSLAPAPRRNRSRRSRARSRRASCSTP